MAEEPAEAGAAAQLPRLRRKRGLLYGSVAVVVVVLIIAALVAVDFATRGSRESTPVASSDGLGPGPAGISIGSGGTATGADGQTPIGYTPTCDGAVQAATNYLQGLWSSSTSVKDGKDKAITSIDGQIGLARQVMLPGVEQSAAVRSLEAAKGLIQSGDRQFDASLGITVQARPGWGGSYKVLSCTPGQAAQIGILYCKSTTTEQPGSVPTISCLPVAPRLLWANGDWKIVETATLSAVLAGYYGPSNGYTEDLLPLSVSERDKYLKLDAGGTDQGWVDYADINRK